VRIGVCIKQVPDTDSHLRVGASGRDVDDGNLNWVISSCDLCALEEALLLAESLASSGSGRPELVVFSLGPARVEEALRKALALGVDRAVHLPDEDFRGGDAFADGLVLAAAIEREACQLVLAGAQSDDLGQAATPAVIAETLGRPYAWLVMAVEVEAERDTVRVVRELEGGMNEVVRMPLPAVLAIQAGINKPRFATLRGTLSARRKPLVRMERLTLGLAGGSVGAAGARIKVAALELPPAGAGGVLIEGAVPERAASELIVHLEREAAL